MKRAGWIVWTVLLGCSGSAKDSTWIQREAPERPPVDPAALDLAEETPIVFRSDRAQASVGDLYTMASDGSDLRALTSGGDHYFPRWSPDGRSIALRTSPEPLVSELAVMSASGSVLRPLTQGEVGFAPVPPSWSRDGKTIAFGSLRDDEVRVWVVPSAGGTDEMLFPALAGGQDCATWAWSQPSRIAFTGPLDAGEDLWMVEDTESTGFVNLTQGRVFAPSFPRWSPDGSRIAFSAYARSEDGSIEGLTDREGGMAPGSDIFVVNVSTFELTRVTSDPAQDQSPVWSPEGDSLLIASDRDGDFDLWLIPLDHPEQARDLIDDRADPHSDEAPDWYWAPRR